MNKEKIKENIILGLVILVIMFVVVNMMPRNHTYYDSGGYTNGRY